MNVKFFTMRFLQFWGVDRAIAYTLIGRGWTVIAGPVSVILIARFLSPEEQGFYYTFASILALQVFFELGLSYVILHFASHEKAKLEWSAAGALEGDADAKSRLATLLRLALVWYGVAALLLIAIVLPAGLVFFSINQPPGASIVWRLPWTLIVLFSGFNLAVTPAMSVLEGCGLVAELAFMRIGQGILGSLLLWSVLFARGGLFATAVLAVFGFLWASGWLLLYKRAFFFDLLRSKVSAQISWREELWPFQWKIALSWLSGYFIFQMFNPVMFAFHGAVAAGRMGMSLSITGAISAMATAWVVTKAAPFGGLIANREFRKLDKLFFTCLWQSTAVLVLGGVAFWSAAWYLSYINHPISKRILEPLPLALLIGATVLNHIVFAEALYLRSHKQEPFLWPSILGGCLCGSSTYFFGKHYGATGIMLGYFILTIIIGVGAGTWIFFQKRRLWHTDFTLGSEIAQSS